MGVSDRRALHRRIVAGSVGVAVVDALFAITAFSEDGLSWRTIAIVAVIVAVSVALLPLCVVVTEAFRQAMRGPDR